MSYGQLSVAVNGSAGTTVIQTLVSSGAVSRTEAIAAGLVQAPIYIPDFVTAQFLSVSAMPTQTVATTQLQLTFNTDPTTLSIDNITVTGAKKGTLSGTGTTRTLTISNVTISDGENVTVSISNPSGYIISGSSKNVAVVNSFAFKTGMPATYNTALTVSSGTTFDLTEMYTWYRSADAVWDGSDTVLTTGTSYTPNAADIGKYLIVKALDNSTIDATIATSKAIGSIIGQTISGTFPASADSINLTEFAGNESGIEAAVDIDGTGYGAYFAISIDQSGSAVISGISGVTTSTKVKVRFKETTTSYAGLEQVVLVDEEII